MSDLILNEIPTTDSSATLPLILNESSNINNVNHDDEEDTNNNNDDEDDEQLIEINSSSDNNNTLSIENVFSLSGNNIGKNKELEKILSVYYDIIPQNNINEEEKNEISNPIKKKQNVKKKKKKRPKIIPTSTELIPQMKIKFNENEDICSTNTRTTKKIKKVKLKKNNKQSSTNTKLLYQKYTKKLREMKKNYKRLKSKLNKKGNLSTKTNRNELTVDVAPPPLVHYRDDKPANLEAPPELSPQPAFLQTQNYQLNPKNNTSIETNNYSEEEDYDVNNDEKSYHEDLQRFKTYFPPKVQKIFEGNSFNEEIVDEDILMEDSEHEYDDIMMDEQQEDEEMNEESVLIGDWINEPEYNDEEIYETPQVISTGKEERDTIDGIEFLSFRTQKDMDEFTRIEQDYKGITAPVDDGYDISYDEIGDPSTNRNYPGSASSCSSTSHSRRQGSDDADDGFESCGVRGILDENSLDCTWLSDNNTTTTTSNATTSSSSFVPISVLPSTSGTFTTGRPIPLPAKVDTHKNNKKSLNNNKSKTMKSTTLIATSPSSSSSSSTVVSSNYIADCDNKRIFISRRPILKRAHHNKPYEKIKTRKSITKKLKFPMDLDTNYDYIWNAGHVIRLTGSNRNTSKPKIVNTILNNNKEFFIESLQNQNYYEVDEKENNSENIKNLNNPTKLNEQKINVIIKSEIGVKPSTFVTKCLLKIRKDKIDIDESWAKFAVSTLIVLPKPTRGRKPKIKPPPPPIPLPEKITFQLSQKEFNFKFTSLLKCHENEIVIKDMMNEMLNSIELSLNPPKIDYDPDQTPPANEKEILLDKNKNKRYEYEYDKYIQKPQKRKMNLRLELKRLNADLIFMPSQENQDVNDNINDKQCNLESCRITCVCSSLNYQRPQFLQHCGKIDCMFDCKCKEFKTTSTSNRLTLLSGPSTSSTIIPSTITSSSSSTNKLLAPLEKEFKQTVIFNDTSTLVVGRRKREIKLPERYRDSVLGREFALSELKMLAGNVSDDLLDLKSAFIVPKYVPVDMLYSKPSSASTSPQKQNWLKHYKIKPSVCRLAEDSRLKDLWIWCMEHKKYKCECINYQPTTIFPFDLQTRPDSFICNIKTSNKQNDNDNVKNNQNDDDVNNTNEHNENETENNNINDSENNNVNDNENNNENEKQEVISCARVTETKINYLSRNKNINYCNFLNMLFSIKKISPILITKEKNEEFDSENEIDVINDKEDIKYFIRFKFLPNTHSNLKEIHNLKNIFNLDDDYNGVKTNKNSTYILLNWNYIQSVINNKIYQLWKHFSKDYGDILILTGQSNVNDTPYMVNITDWIPNILPFPPIEYYHLRSTEPLPNSEDFKRFVILKNYQSDIYGLRILGYMDISETFYSQKIKKDEDNYKKKLERCIAIGLKNALKPKNDIMPDQETDITPINKEQNYNQSHVNELLFHVPLPKVESPSRWFMVSLNQAFSILIIRKYSQAISFTELVQAIDIAKNSKRTIRIPVGKAKHSKYESPLFGIFALPQVFTRVFIGPYKLDEPSFTELYMFKDGKYELIPTNSPILMPNRVTQFSSLDNHIENILNNLGSKSKTPSIGIWLNTKPDDSNQIELSKEASCNLPWKRKSKIDFRSSLKKTGLFVSKFKRMMVYAIHFTEIGYFETRLYGNTSYRVIHPETQVELLFDGHQNLFLWLNMYLKLTEYPLKWGIQNFPKTESIIKPFNKNNFLKVRDTIIQMMKGEIPLESLLTFNKSNKSLLKINNNKPTLTSNSESILNKERILSTNTSSISTCTATTSTSSNTAPTTLHPSTSGSNTIDNSLNNNNKSNKSSQIVVSSPFTLKTSTTRFAPMEITSTMIKIDPKTKQNIITNEYFQYILGKLIKLIPLNDFDNENINGIILKLNETISNEENRDNYLQEERLRLYNERQRITLKIYREAHDMKNDEIKEILENVTKIISKKIPKIRFPSSTKEGAVIRQSLYKLLKKINPHTQIQSTNFVNKNTKNIKSHTKRTESPVSISLVSVTKNEDKCENASSDSVNNSTPGIITTRPANSTNLNQQLIGNKLDSKIIDTSKSGSTSTSSSPSAISLALSSSSLSSSSSLICQNKLSRFKNELDDDVTVTYISSKESQKNKIDNSIPIFDLTSFSDDDNDNLRDNVNTNNDFAKVEFSKIIKNNELEIRNILSSSSSPPVSSSTTNIHNNPLTNISPEKTTTQLKNKEIINNNIKNSSSLRLYSPNGKNAYLIKPADMHEKFTINNNQINKKNQIVNKTKSSVKLKRPYEKSTITKPSSTITSGQHEQIMNGTLSSSRLSTISQTPLDPKRIKLDSVNNSQVSITSNNKPFLVIRNKDGNPCYLPIVKKQQSNTPIINKIHNASAITFKRDYSSFNNLLNQKTLNSNDKKKLAIRHILDLQNKNSPTPNNKLVIPKGISLTKHTNPSKIITEPVISPKISPKSSTIITSTPPSTIVSSSLSTIESISQSTITTTTPSTIVSSTPSTIVSTTSSTILSTSSSTIVSAKSSPIISTTASKIISLTPLTIIKTPRITSKPSPSKSSPLNKRISILRNNKSKKLNKFRTLPFILPSPISTPTSLTITLTTSTTPSVNSKTYSNLSTKTSTLSISVVPPSGIISHKQSPNISNNANNISTPPLSSEVTKVKTSLEADCSILKNHNLIQEKINKTYPTTTLIKTTEKDTN